MKRLTILLMLAVLPVLLGGCVVAAPYGPGEEAGYRYEGDGRNDRRDDEDRNDPRRDRDGKGHHGDRGDRGGEGHEGRGSGGN